MSHPIARRRAMAAAAAWPLVATLPSGARAQAAYPSRPITVTVGLQAGTGSDVAVRSLAERVAVNLGQPMVIDNLPGAGGALAAARVARASPDGYQLAALSSATANTVPILDPKTAFDPFKDLVPIAIVATVPSVLFVRADFPAQTLDEFIAVARQRPGRLTYASGGNGSAQHLGMEVLKARANLDIVHVPYRGSAQATLDVAAGRVDAGLQGLSTVLPFLKSGKLRAIVSTGRQRSPLLPQLPTAIEAGIDGYVYEPWTALFAPAGTPPTVIARLAAEVRKGTGDVALRERWTAIGLEPVDETPEQIGRRIRAEYELNAATIKERGIRAE